MYSALFSAGAACAILASGLAGCSGGGGTTAVSPVTSAQNAAATAPQGDERVVQSIDVSKAGASTIQSKVTHESAYGSPLQGETPRKLATGQRAIRTGGFYDLAYYGGPTLGNTTSIDLYVNCGSTCWGTTSPGTFLGRLATSTLIHVVDQYTGSTSNNRYPYGGGWTVNYNTSGTLQDQDIYNIIHAVAVSQGTGYGKIYHVFLQSGVQQCSQNAGGCYGVAGGYCAYHGNVDFGDIGHTIYSVEPYQGISGCSSPSGKITDSTASTLSHEFIEAITDPDVPQNIAWYNNSGGEIGDICRSSYGTVSVSGFSYYIQREYSNRVSACTFTP
ncbi:MAG: hypothetical protein M3154_00580 [Candidatus Eremiobacteraeota bacterium]|nr:hypothetical protein [Candidatus Eremiobacteraeota bacterium]